MLEPNYFAEAIAGELSEKGSYVQLFLKPCDIESHAIPVLKALNKNDVIKIGSYLTEVLPGSQLHPEDQTKAGACDEHFLKLLLLELNKELFDTKSFFDTLEANFDINSDTPWVKDSLYSFTVSLIEDLNQIGNYKAIEQQSDVIAVYKTLIALKLKEYISTDVVLKKLDEPTVFTEFCTTHVPKHLNEKETYEYAAAFSLGFGYVPKGFLKEEFITAFGIRALQLDQSDTKEKQKIVNLLRNIPQTFKPNLIATIRSILQFDSTTPSNEAVIPNEEMLCVLDIIINSDINKIVDISNRYIAHYPKYDILPAAIAHAILYADNIADFIPLLPKQLEQALKNAALTNKKHFLKAVLERAKKVGKENFEGLKTLASYIPASTKVFHLKEAISALMMDDLDIKDKKTLLSVTKAVLESNENLLVDRLNHLIYSLSNDYYALGFILNKLCYPGKTALIPSLNIDIKDILEKSDNKVVTKYLDRLIHLASVSDKSDLQELQTLVDYAPDNEETSKFKIAIRIFTKQETKVTNKEHLFYLITLIINGSKDVALRQQRFNYLIEASDKELKARAHCLTALIIWRGTFNLLDQDTDLSDIIGNGHWDALAYLYALDTHICSSTNESDLKALQTLANYAPDNEQTKRFKKIFNVLATSDFESCDRQDIINVTNTICELKNQNLREELLTKLINKHSNDRNALYSIIGIITPHADFIIGNSTLYREIKSYQIVKLRLLFNSIENRRAKYYLASKIASSSRYSIGLSLALPESLNCKANMFSGSMMILTTFVNICSRTIDLGRLLYTSGDIASTTLAEQSFMLFASIAFLCTLVDARDESRLLEISTISLLLIPSLDIEYKVAICGISIAVEYYILNYIDKPDHVARINKVLKDQYKIEV